jgi:ribose/xylose/arabinose/galactoside ABC-type transport system permease subunit
MTVARRSPTIAGAVLGDRSGPLLLALAVVLVIIGIGSPRYFSVDNIRVIGLNVTSIGIASVGTALLIIAGKVDLSLGSMFAATAYTSAYLSVSMPAWLAISIGILTGGLVGLVNGLLVWRIRVSPIIVTLGSLALIRGVLLVVSSGRGVASVPPEFTELGRATIAGVPLQLWLLAIIVVSVAIVLGRTTMGRYIYAIGGSADAAEVAGIPVRRVILGLFAFNGLLVGLAGVIAASRFGTATSQFGQGFELDVVTAVILGGVAFTGGEGTIRGVMIAVVFLGVVNSGLISLGIPAFYVDVVKGGALIASVAIDQLTHERRERYRKAIAMAEFAQELSSRAEQLRRPTPDDLGIDAPQPTEAPRPTEAPK